MELQLFSLLCMVALVVADDSVVVNKPGELDFQYTDTNGTVQQYPSRRDDQLYHEVAIENYDRALTIAQEFIDRREFSVIKRIIDQLIGHRRTYVAAFAYKLYVAGHKKVVEDTFPAPYRMVFNNTVVKFVNNRYNLPIEFSRWDDKDGDYPAYAKEENANSNNFNWKLEPVVDGKSVYFKIRHFSNNIYLKLGNDMDSDGDYQAFGSTNSDTERHQWMFQPVFHNEKLCFCIINRAHYQALKVAVSVNQGNRKVYSTYGDFYNYPERYGWSIEVISDSGKYGL